MLTDEIKQQVEVATVKITRGDDGFGSGVLILGEMILTATHCVQHTTDGFMVWDSYIETLKTSQGFLKAQATMVECVSDIAVLESLDGQEFWDEYIAFETFCETVNPLNLTMDALPLRRPFPVHLRTCEGEWMSGEATIYNPASPTIGITFPHTIPSGTSGSPIVNDGGEIVAIVSNSSESSHQRQSIGSHPFPAMALPSWILQRIGRVSLSRRSI